MRLLKTLYVKKSRLGFSDLSALGFCREGFASRAGLLAKYGRGGLNFLLQRQI